MFKIIAICCLITIAISFKKVDGQYVYKPAFIQKEYQGLEHIQASLEKTLEGYIHSLKNVETACAKVNHDIQNGVQDLSLILHSCTNETNESSVIESGIQKLIDMADGLEKNITGYVHEILTTCSKVPSNLTLFDTCYDTLKQNGAKISLTDVGIIFIAKVLKLVPFIQKWIPFIPNVELCYKDALHQFTPQYLKGIYYDLVNCTQSIQRLF